jgi:type VI secretion system ImpC/EvpB family protein
VAAAAFAPFIAAAHPTLLDLKSFADLERPLNLPRTFEQLQYLKWRQLRQAEDTRFLALVLPRILLRAPYEDDNHRADGFLFREEVERPGREDYLWGNAAYAYGAVLARTFGRSGWLADIRGVRRGEDTGGLVTGLPLASFKTDRPGLVPRSSTEVIITDALDQVLGDLGFLPLCWCQDTDLSAFYGSQSIQASRSYDDLAATVNARMSAMLQYVFCASRFGHYIKVIMRDQVGGYSTTNDIERYLSNWLHQYTNANDDASPELKARFPLRESRVVVSEVPGFPGRYNCAVYFRPHFQLDQMVGSIRLETRLSRGPGS